ncbi:MAG: hypothetical protein IJ163_02860 [Bacteroidaceae bacterium]|nr:hypothetical protein [Bacteroidaceae bacterium]
MKKIYLTLLALLAFAGAKAQVTETDWQSMSDVVALKSSEFIYGSREVQIPICIKAHADFQGATFYIQLPEGVTFTSLDPVVEARRASFSATGYIHSYEPQTDGTYKVLSTVAANTSDGQKGYYSKGSADDDYLFSYISVNISNLAPGEYPIKIVNETLFAMFNEEGEPSRQLNQEITSKLVITNEVVLDELATEYPTEYKGVNVRVKRSFSFDKWNTFCLPVAMDETTCKAVFGQNVDIAEFNGYDYNADTKHISVKFNHVEKIKANTPVIIKIASADTKTYDAKKKEFTLTNVNITPEVANKVRTRVGNGMMVGTYTDGTILYVTEEDAFGDPVLKYQYVFLNGDKFYYASPNTKPMKGLRAYFYFLDDGNTPLNAGAGVKFNFVVDDEPTAINGISSVEKVAEGVYTVSGQKVNESSLEILPKGVYIVNGKKVFKK